ELTAKISTLEKQRDELEAELKRGEKDKKIQELSTELAACQQKLNICSKREEVAELALNTVGSGYAPPTQWSSLSSKLNLANKSFTTGKVNHASLEKQHVPRRSFMYDKEVTPMNQFGVISYSKLGMILPLASFCLDRSLSYPNFRQLAVRSSSFAISLMAAYVAKQSVEEHKSGWIVKSSEFVMCCWDVLFCLVALVYTVFGSHLSQPLEMFQSFMLCYSFCFHFFHFLWNYLTAEEESEERLPLLG
ncbi:hypothetical protein FRX31_024320, partial [Thalictrum thalictroides]